MRVRNYDVYITCIVTFFSSLFWEGRYAQSTVVAEEPEPSIGGGGACLSVEPLDL